MGKGFKEHGSPETPEIKVEPKQVYLKNTPKNHNLEDDKSLNKLESNLVSTKNTLKKSIFIYITIFLIVFCFIQNNHINKSSNELVEYNLKISEQSNEIEKLTRKLNSIYDEKNKKQLISGKWHTDGNIKSSYTTLTISDNTYLFKFKNAGNTIISNATYEIVNDQLYLTNVESTYNDHKNIKNKDYTKKIKYLSENILVLECTEYFKMK